MFEYVTQFFRNIPYLIDQERICYVEVRDKWADGFNVFIKPFLPLLDHPLKWYADANGYPEFSPTGFKPRYLFWQGLQKDLSDRGIGYYMPTWFYFARTMIVGSLLLILWAIPLILLTLVLPVVVWLGSAWLVFVAVGLLFGASA